MQCIRLEDKMSKIKAICISEKRGTRKFMIEEANFITEFGIEHDAHAGDWHRQVSFLGLNDNLERDIYNGYTGFGPHKDDLKIDINGTDIRQFGSQGQQRTAALSMKLAEIELIKQETGHNAVLLLDDVLSELDSKRQKFLIETMKDAQIFVTATGMEDLRKLLPDGNVYYVDKGKVNLYNR